MSLYKNLNNSSGISTDLNVTGSINSNNIITSNLIATGNINFPVGSINANCVNGLLSELQDQYLYALLVSSGQTFQGTQTFQNGVILQGSNTFSSGSTIDFTNTTVSNLTLQPSNVLLGNVNNTSDVNKPVSTATSTALALKSNLSSPTFTGTLTSPSISTTALSLNGIDLYTTLSNLAPLLNPSFSGTLTLSKFGILSNTSNFWLYNNANSPDVNYAIFQNNSGATIINSSTGQSVSFNINNVNYASLSSSAFTVTNSISTPSLILNGVSLATSLALLAPLSSPSFSGTLSVPNITLNSVSLSTTLSNKQAILNSTSSNAISCLSLTTPTISLNSVDLGTTLSNKQVILNSTSSNAISCLSLTTPTISLNSVDLGTTLSNKQAILNSTSSNAISCLSLTTPTISLNSVDLGTTLSNKQAILNSTSSNAISCLSLAVPTISLNSVDLGTTLSNKQAILNSTSLNTISCLSLTTPTISLNSVDLGTSLGLLAPKLNATLTSPTINTPIINNPTLNNTTVNNGILINQITQNGASFGSGMTFSYGNPSQIYNIIPNYLGTFFSGGCPFSASGLPTLSNQNVFINWAQPLTSTFQSNADAYMNSAFIEVAYWIQESPINTGSSTFPIYNITAFNYTNSQISTTTNSNVNMNIGSLFCCGVGIFYVVSSLSGTNYSGTNNGSTGYNTYVKYLSGSFSGGGGSMTTSTNRYGSTFTPVQFTRYAYNKVGVTFSFPQNNNSTNSNTYGTGYYISSYGCSARIVGSDAANGGNIGNIYPSNYATQACNSFSYSGRAYFSTS